MAGDQKPGAARTEPPGAEQIWSWLGNVPDPEIPVLSVVDLGIVREVRWEHGNEGEELVVTVTPTYCGCPATAFIMLAIERELRAKGIKALRLEQRLAPPWTTEWISPEGRRRLKEFGIAPPAETVRVHPLSDRFGAKPVTVRCPRCGSEKTERVSAFGSTPCKAQYRCRACLEPFEYFKCI